MITFFYYIWAVFYFFWPAYIANALPPLISRVNILNWPVDNNKMLWGAPILGSHKTWRGLATELITCSLFTQLFFQLNEAFNLGIYEFLGFSSYTEINGYAFGALLGAGIIFGDLLFAFIKRRLKLRPGFPFVPFDQINYVLGAFVFIQPVVKLNTVFWLTLIVLTFVVHIGFNRLGYNLGLHKAKW